MEPNPNNAAAAVDSILQATAHSEGTADFAADACVESWVDDVPHALDVRLGE